ncbi:MAG: T9SS type A sorting domain-containing protein [Bacteroidota bacterium]
MRKFFIIVIMSCLAQVTVAQTDDWKTIYPGYDLSPGRTRLIIKQNCIYVYNTESSSLLRSINGGINWELIAISSDSARHEYLDVYFVNDSVGYLCGYDGFLYGKCPIAGVVKKTTDRGQSWQNVSTGIAPSSILTHIYFFNEQVGMAFGTGHMESTRFATDNGGQTWTQLNNSSPETPMVNFSSFNGMEGIASGSSNYMHLSFTTDQGSTWTTRHLHGKDSPTGLKFFDNQNWVIVCNDTIYTTHNSAMSFSSRFKFPYSGCVRTFDMIDMQRGFFCTNKAIYYTTDAGQSWRLSYTNPGTQLRDLRISGNKVFVSTTCDNIILKLDISDLVVSIAANKTSEGFNLYPNPASDKLFVTAPASEKLTEVVIYDQLGKMIRTQKLTESRAIDIKNIIPGVYEVKIISGKKVYTNKIIIN